MLLQLKIVLAKFPPNPSPVKRGSNLEAPPSSRGRGLGWGNALKGYTNMAEMVQEATGAENVLWDLSDLYKGMDDPAIERDFTESQSKAEAFAARYRGKVATL